MMLLLLFLPLLAGITIAILNIPSIHNQVNNFHYFLYNHMNYLKIKNDKFSRYIFRPSVQVLYSISKYCESIPQQRIKSGVRVILLSYGIIILLVILYSLLSMVVVFFIWLVIMVFVVLVLISANKKK